MNHDRIFCVLNALTVLIGYRVHWLQEDGRRYRLSLWGVLNYISLVLLYAICANEFMGTSTVLSMLKAISPFLWKLTNFHFLVGIKVFLLVLYEMRYVNRSANETMEVLSASRTRKTQKFSLSEAFSYFLMFSTLLICLGVGLYIAVEMKFKLPPVRYILVGVALFLPHFAVAGALKWHSVSSWLYTEELYDLATSLDDLVLPVTEIKDNKVITIAIVGQDSLPASQAKEADKLLQDIHGRLQKFASMYADFRTALWKQLLLLILLNANGLLSVTYGLVFFETNWSVLFNDSLKRVFYAGNVGVFVFVSWDYLCLCLSQYSFDRVKSKFLRALDCIFEHHDSSVKPETRHVLKQMRRILKHRLNFQLIGPLKLNVWGMVWLHQLVATVIGIVVVYHYLNSEISTLSMLMDNERGSGDDDE